MGLLFAGIHTDCKLKKY